MYLLIKEDIKLMALSIKEAKRIRNESYTSLNHFYEKHKGKEIVFWNNSEYYDLYKKVESASNNLKELKRKSRILQVFYAIYKNKKTFEGTPLEELKKTYEKDMLSIEQKYRRKKVETEFSDVIIQIKKETKEKIIKQILENKENL